MGPGGGKGTSAESDRGGGEVGFACIRSGISRRLAGIREGIRGRSARREVTLVAVTKYVDMDRVLALLTLGAVDLGESDVKQFVARKELVDRIASGAAHADVCEGAGAPSGEAVAAYREAGCPSPVWHFIGRLHSDRANRVVGRAALVHSVNSIEIAKRLDRVASAAGRVQEILLQVNTSGEASKQGFSPDEAVAAIETIRDLHSISVKGLMTMAPDTEDGRIVSGCFAGARELLERMNREDGLEMQVLSMGMSGDHLTAVDEGATMVRIGTRLFFDS